VTRQFLKLPASPAAVLAHTRQRSPGHSLDAPVSRFMSSRLGYDFSRVRIHQDAPAARAARAFGARAFTLGPDVFFDSGEYRPGTQSGRETLAHELTHVIQQGAAPSRRAFAPAASADAAEQDARSTGKAVADGAAANAAHPAVSCHIQRSPRGDDDPIHRPIIEQYRREHGLPAGGVDENGVRVGPTDAEIKYGRPALSTSVTVPGPPDSHLSPEQARALVQQAALGNVAIDSEIPPVPATPAAPRTPAFAPLAREPIRFGVDMSVPWLNVTLLPRHADAFRFRFYGRPVDFGHEPGFSVGIGPDSRGNGTFFAGLACTLLNAHFNAFGYEFLELALGQIGATYDATGALTFNAGAAAEFHTPDPHISLVLSTGGSRVRESDGSWSTQFNPISFFLTVHALNP